MKIYKYKIVYRMSGTSGNEIKVDSYDELTRELGELSMVSQVIEVYQKIKGRYEMIRTIKTE